MPNLGSWEVIFDGEQPLNTQQTAVHACLIYNSEEEIWKVLYFRAFDADTGGINPLVTTRIWDPLATSNPISTQPIPDWPSWTIPPDPSPEPADRHGRLFCCGHCFLPDGKMIAIGGHREPVENGLWARGMLFSYIFDPVSETWSYEGSSSDPVRMQDGRWYPTATIYGQGANTRVLASGGFRYNYKSGVIQPELEFNNDMEIYSPSGNSWTPIANTTNQFSDANYPGVHVIPYGDYAGELFYSIPNHQAKKFNPSGPSWNNVGSSRSEFRGHGCSVLLPLLPGQTAGRVMIIGGAEGDPEEATATCQIINLSDSNPQWTTNTPSMANKRSNGNAVLLPDGKVLVIGGNEGGLYADSVRMTEVYDPSNDSWSDLIEQNYERNYHSTSILFPDGRVWSSGGEDGPPYYGSQNNLEIYSPAYLSDGNRPEILSSPTTISYGNSFSFTTNTSIEWVVLIKLGATTHAFDEDQRCIILSPGNTPVINGGITYSPIAPANANIAPPGYYMIFAVSYKASSTSGTNRIPSIAKFVKLQ